MILTADLVVGFHELDVQHRTMLERLEASWLAAERGDGPATREALAALRDVVMGHFQAEERLMAESGYPERGRHKSAHDIFLQDLAQLAAELDGQGLSASTLHWIGTRLPEWVKFHIQVNDLPLGRYLSARRHGVAGRRGEKPRLA